MQYFAVMGNPIAQSKSPFIHHMFASQAGVDIQYDAVLVEKHLFKDAVEDFFSKEKHIGLNITTPFKEEAFARADVLTDEAKTAGAVNTLYKTVNGLLGHNTDGPGLMQDILRQGQALKDKRILLIGAGGAARGVIMPFINQHVASIHIVNRNVQRARELVQAFSHKTLTAGGFDSVRNERYDVIVNATTLSLQKQLPDIPNNLYQDIEMAYDMVYLSGQTTFMQKAMKAGAKTCSDGLGMLVGQAAKSFELWTGQRVDTTPVLDALRLELNR